jgi:hypothetical protein
MWQPEIWEISQPISPSFEKTKAQKTYRKSLDKKYKKAPWQKTREPP